MSKLVSQTILARIESLSVEIIARQYEIQPDLSDRLTSVEVDCDLCNTRQTLANLAQALNYDSPVLFSDYISWLKIYLESRDVPVRDLRINLHCVQQILSLHFGRDEANILAEYLDAARAELEKTMPYIYTTELRGEYAGLAHEYLSALLAGESQPAINLLHHALTSQNITLPDFYLRVLQPVQHEIGRLWQFNQLDNAHMQAAAAITRQVFDHLSSHLPPAGQNNFNLLALCVGEERHLLGARMVADLFAAAGWNTHCPPEIPDTAEVIDLILSRSIQVLALSVTLAIHLNAAEQFITAIRASAAARVYILAGGAPFNLVPHLWRRIGADGSASNAQTAVRLAQQLFPQH